ncbi:MAG: hypothetical protein R6V41_04960 [Desulfobacteraceae bacterium]
MKFTHPDSEFNSAIEKAIHTNVITRDEYHKILTLFGRDLEFDAHEKRLLDHIQGIMGTGQLNNPQG